MNSPQPAGKCVFHRISYFKQMTNSSYDQVFRMCPFHKSGSSVLTEIHGGGHMPGSNPQPPTSTYDNAHVTVVAELNMLFRNNDTRCMLFRNKTQDICFS
jgi:hypothetical protein